MLKDRAAAVAAVVFASAMMLAMHGYQFGKNNHTVYLIDALRHASPGVLDHDWYTTRTLQYHAVFGWLTRGLLAMGIIEPAFLIGYLVLLVMLHVAWWRIVRALGGDAGVFIMSAALFQLMAGGTGLGMYHFLQDSAFLPSNIAAVAMLWGIAMWLEGRTIASGVWLGIAGLIHLNYALVAPVLWVAVQLRGRRDRALWIGSAAALLPCLANIAVALQTTRQRSGAMPLAEFVELYVQLRHPHHYDPSSWPAWLWSSFLLPPAIALIAFAASRRREPIIAPADISRLARLLAIFSIIVIVALIGAGLVYVHEALVQASLYRFSVFVKLLSCVAAAFVLRAARVATPLSIAAGAVLIAACVWRGPYAGMWSVPADDASYLAACDWVRGHTQVEDVFLVPPSDLEFRLRAQRSIVVNFKGIPQLSAEMKEWRQRMQDALDMMDLTALPRPFPVTLAAMQQRYDALPPQHLLAVARKYGARYVLTRARWPDAYDSARIDVHETGWFLYDSAKAP